MAGRIERQCYTARNPPPRPPVPVPGVGPIPRTLLAVLLTLAVALPAGAAGGYLASSFGDSEEAPAASATPSQATDQRIRAAVDRVLPNVLLVVAESASGTNIGSAVMVSANGHALTASHVLNGATQVRVYLPSGEERPARVLADDAPFTDLAMLQVPPQGLRPIAFGSSENMKPGDLVLAISGGTGQFGTGNSVALGVVSGLKRALPRSGVTFDDLVQTDAAINHGDSGGALVNLSGELIGVITTVIRESGGVDITGVSFAQSSDSLRPVVASVIANGRFPRPRLGIEYPDRQHLEISPRLATERSLPVQQGALVTAPAANSPAARAGMVAGDIIVGVNGTAVTFDTPFVNLLKLLPRGARVELQVLRGGRPVVVPITPEE